MIIYNQSSEIINIFLNKLWRSFMKTHFTQLILQHSNVVKKWQKKLHYPGFVDTIVMVLSET